MYTVNGGTEFLASAGQRRPLIYMPFFIPVVSIQSSYYNQFWKGRKLTMVRRTFEQVIIAIYVRRFGNRLPKETENMITPLQIVLINSSAVYNYSDVIFPRKVT